MLRGCMTLEDRLEEIEQALDDGEYEEALSLADEGLVSHANDPGLLGYRGEALAGLGEAEDAVRSYESATRRAPDQPLPLYVQGAVVHVDETAEAIIKAVTEAERISGVHITQATVNVNGVHVEGMDSKGVIAISSNNRQIVMMQFDPVNINGSSPFQVGNFHLILTCMLDPI